MHVSQMTDLVIFLDFAFQKIDNYRFRRFSLLPGGWIVFCILYFVFCILNFVFYILYFVRLFIYHFHLNVSTLIYLFVNLSHSTFLTGTPPN